MSPPIPAQAHTAQTRISAASKVYHIPELLQRILRQLDRNDLARFIRVGRRSLPAVARELWGTANQRDVLALDLTSVRHRIYLDAVSVIIIDSPPTGKDGPPMRNLTSYTPGLFEALIPPLSCRCSRLRRVEVKKEVQEVPVQRRLGGPGFNPTSDLTWVVEPHCYSTDPQSNPNLDCGFALDSGTITVVRSMSYSINRPPPLAFTSANACTPPSPRWVLRQRYNLEVRTADRPRSPQALATWKAALAQDGRFRNLYKAVDFGSLTLTLGQLGSLYEQQRVEGHVDLLEKIVAPATSPWSIGDFETFARLATTSLSILNLGKTTSGALPSADLPRLISMIRNHLPQLAEAQIPLDARPTMERDCLALLSDDVLDQCGTIRTLTVYVTDSAFLPDSPFFNTFRLLAPLVAAQGQMQMTSPGATSFRGCAFLKHMRDQTAIRRKHLSTADFYSLGYYDLKSFRYFDFYNDGRIRRRVENEAEEWLGIAQAARDAPRSRLSDYAASLRTAAAEAEMLRRSTKVADDTVTLAKMRDLLAAVKEAGKIGAEVIRIATEKVEGAENLGAEIERSIGLMERAEAERKGA